MKPLKFLRAIIPPGPILTMTLIGVMLLGVLLYYKAGRIQRFLEPTVAINEPRISFNRSVSNLLIEELGSSDVQGVVYTGSQLLIHKTLLYQGADFRGNSPVMQKLGRVFYSVLNDDALRPYIESVIVSTRAQLSTEPEQNRHMREFHDTEAQFILNALLSAKPELEQSYGRYFESTVVLMDMRSDEGDWVAFRIIPSEKPHIDLLKKLQKYAQ